MSQFDTIPLVIYGPSGIGKSTIMTYIIKKVSCKNKILRTKHFVLLIFKNFK